MRVPVPRRRSSLRETPLGLEITIPCKRYPLAIVFMSVWLAFWAVGELAAARQILFGENGLADAFLLVWLTIWTLGGGWAFYSLLWLAVGKEVIVMSAGTLAIRRDIVGLGRTREYDLEHVRHLRVSPLSNTLYGRGSGHQPWASPAGAVAFDYGAATIRFGAVEEAEAALIIADLKARHSFNDQAA